MRGARRIRWLALVALISINCTALERRPSTVVTGDGVYLTVDDTSGGCEGPVTRQTHTQQGGGIGVRHEGAEGQVYGGRARLISGRLDAYEVDDQPTRPSPEALERYLIGYGGVFGGYHLRWIGGELGLGAVATGDVMLVPWGKALFGDLNTLWLEIEAGSDDPLYYTNMLGLALGLRTEHVRGRVGVSLLGHFFKGTYEEEAERQTALRFGGEDSAFIFDLGLQKGPFGLRGGGAVGEKTWATRIGLAYELE